MPDTKGLDRMIHVHAAEEAGVPGHNPGQGLPEQGREQRLNAKGQGGNFQGDGNGPGSKL